MSRPTQIERMISKGQMVPLLFTQDQVAASQTDVQLEIMNMVFSAGTSDATFDYPANDAYVMPFEGEIIAISAHLTAAATAGQLDIGPTIGGTEKTDLALAITTETAKSATVLRGTIPFAKDDKIGAEITTNSSWDGTSSDLAVTVWVILALEGI
ncbi:hypothetical protein GCM10012275_38330 [Longimycelium tulufanense]|uniref:Capsid protein n=1 Tax=Longimycelium tulufanense TaxID=907463 RepID=A0A8J3FW77_9PSEU|nr:hypothetical protein [Longimycelium tulufanense]GGM64115.1 hypothetical protein GCM10012275_38330 [Longimycelium tulufanense]